MRFRDNLIRLLNESGMSPDAFIEAVDAKDVYYLDLWLNGTKLPTQEQLEKISKLFHVTIEELLGDDFGSTKKPETATRIYNVDAHYSGLSITVIELFNVFRMFLIACLMIFTLLTIKQIPNDPLLYLMIFPYIASLICTIIYGYRAIRERKLFKVRSLQFIKKNHMHRPSIMMRLITVILLFSFVSYFWLNTLRHFASQSILIYSIVVILLSISINLINWMFFQSITVVSIDVFRYNQMHEFLHPFEYVITLQNGKKSNMIIDQVNAKYFRMVYNGIEYFQSNKKSFKVMKESRLEKSNERTYLVGDQMLEVRVKSRFFLPPIVSFPNAKGVKFIKPIYELNFFILTQIVYGVGILFILFLLL